MTEPSSRRRPSDNWMELRGQLLRELGRLEQGHTEEAALLSAYVQHTQVLAWRGVADGHMRAPEEARECLRAARHFVERYVPALEPPAAAATEIQVVSESLSLAAEALAARRMEDRISEERSKTERAILEILAGSRDAFLRRGEIHERLADDDRPSPPRVGQILAQFFEENLVLKIHGRAQGNPNAAFYALSPVGVELCRSLGLEREANLLPAIAAATLDAACDPNLSWEWRDLARGALASWGRGRRKNQALKALIAKEEASPDPRVRALVRRAEWAVVNFDYATEPKTGGEPTIYLSQSPKEAPQPLEVVLTEG